MDTATVISIAKQFSRYPAGRYVDDGPASGQLFREQFLVPAMRDGQKIEIDFDGARGYGSSFLEEAFGGLVREGFPAAFVLDHIVFRATDKTIVEEVKEYISEGDDGHQA